MYDRKYRNSTQRMLVLRAVKLQSEPLTAEAVFRTVRKVDPGLGKATVYRNLDLLTERGTITAYEGEDGVRRFVGSSLHVATFRCQRCGREHRPPSQTLQRVNRMMWGGQTVFFSRLTAQGLCGACMRVLKRTKIRV